jgi:predicted DNA-binding transcriptional regulator YafY
MYHPTSRVLAVLEWLQDKPLVNGRELAERLETDVRTVRRYITKLQDVGIPIESIPGRFGGYQLRPGFRLPPLIFSDDEAAAVLLSLVASSELTLSLSKPAVESALAKITRVLPKATWDQVHGLSSVAFLASSRTGSQPPIAMLLELSRAAADERCVRIEYQAEETTVRVVEPYGLAGFQGHWYVVGYCRLRQDRRMFRLDRILSFETLASTFQRPAGFDTETYIREGLKTRHRWTVRIASDASLGDLSRVSGDLWEREPGGTASTARVADLDFTARALLFSELVFRVLGPPEFRAACLRVAERAEQAAR